MKILGIILIIIGGFWIFSRLLNQPVMFRIIKDKIHENGLFFGIRRYLLGELFGFGFGIGIMWIGFYLSSPELLHFYILGTGILLSTVFLWGGFELKTLPRALIILFGVWGLVFWGIGGLVLGIFVGWITTILIGLFTLILWGNVLNKYEFINNAGGKEVVTLGYKNTEKCDIYWEDIIASKNNKKDIINADGESIMISGFSPSEASGFVNKTCPFCGGDVDRFYFVSNEKRESEYTGWMEACFKCKKPIYFEINVMD